MYDTGGGANESCLEFIFSFGLTVEKLVVGRCEVEGLREYTRLVDSEGECEY